MGSLCRPLSLALACSFALITTFALSQSQQLINYNGILAKQTTDRFGVSLREVWTGDSVLQVLYSDKQEEVLACEETDAPLPLETPAVNSSFILPPEFAWLNLTSLRKDCNAAEAVHTRHRRATKRHSRTRTRHGRKKLRKTRKDKIAKGKKGRWIESLITPGTKWCGPGNMAGKYSDLGMNWQADRCCRNHDRCQKFILGLSRGYNSINVNPFTLSHCSCDRRFRTCLKMAGTAASNFVGKLFFNFVQTKCFVLKTERVCTERNWWGKCQKTELQKLAHIRTNLAY